MATLVPDVDVVEGQAQTTEPATTSAVAKAAIELSVFVEFARAANLTVESPESADAPYPDIHCRINDQEYWFELGRITDTKLARILSNKWPTAPEPFSFAQREPFARIIQQKTKKRYETNGRPVDLVLHFDQQPPDRMAFERFVQGQADALEQLRGLGVFSRVWIYDAWSNSVLWRNAD